jgi:hypothetical protein
MQRNRGGVILDLLAGSIGQPGEAAHVHLHREIALRSA